MQLFGTKGQKFLHCPGTKGQRDKLKILPQDGMGRDSRSKSGTGRGTGQSLFFCQNQGRDGTVTILEHLFLFENIFSLFLNVLSCFRTSFPVLERLFSVLERPFPVLGGFFGKWFCPGTSRDRGFCPGIFTPALVLGQRDNGTRKCFCPGTKGQRDVPSRIVPGRPVPWKP